ncbi:hypothetical protein [Pedococcus sp. 5OH_020]|uniref:hypothetical protein n=1 Tax=Pedococcus sp. 5OH_020 TaxID=2989814 RepID=UPI0022E9CEDA|nr:hypothetical protein [Pedococcus sp. 5OH_020]
MWQRLVERVAPLMEGEPSRLDRLDGLGAGPEHTAATATAPQQQPSTSGVTPGS